MSLGYILNAGEVYDLLAAFVGSYGRETRLCVLLPGGYVGTLSALAEGTDDGEKPLAMLLVEPTDHRIETEIGPDTGVRYVPPQDIPGGQQP